MTDHSTICAISTAPGNGAIAVVRLTGSEAIDITENVFQPVTKNLKLSEVPAQSVHFGRLVYDQKLIDEVLVAVFKAPKTYTGEDIVEISCHGSQYIQQKILQILVKNGARIAAPGEFTQRAYLNGKLDLSQAEAVADLIAASGEAAHRVAMNQMRGGISNELQKLRADLLQFISLIELELDFSEEDVEFADRTALKELLNKISTIIQGLIKSFELGNAIKNGVPVAIIGEPNVGKSTLLNAILNEDKAIVSDIAGTTRDVIEDTFNLKGITYRFIDTAGLRETTDTIETLGIERTYQKIDQSKIILAMFDARGDKAKIEQQLQKIVDRATGDKKIFLVLNKTDEATKTLPKITNKALAGQINVSAKEKVNVDILLDLIAESTSLGLMDNNEVIVSNARHVEALELALQALNRASEGLENGLTNDFLAMDIREVIHNLAGITGEEITTDEVLGNIFGQFCIGK